MSRKGFVTLLSGGGAAQLVTLGMLPVLSRTYDPASFGELSALMAVVSIAAVVVHGRYSLAIPVAQDDRDSCSLLFLSLLLAGVLAVPVVLLMSLAAQTENLSLSGWAFVLSGAAFVFLTAAVDSFAYWRSFRRRFVVSAQNSVVRSVLTGAVQFLAFPLGSLGLMLGAFIGLLSGFLLSVRDCWLNDRGACGGGGKFERLADAAYRYRSYPLFSVPQGWVAALSWNLMPLLLVKYEGVMVAGQYWFAYRLLMAPLTLFNGAYRQSVLPILKELVGSSRVRLATRHVLMLSILFVPIILLVFVFGKEFLGLFAGSKWSDAGVIAAWLVVGVAGDVVKVPVLCLLQARGEQRRLFLWECAVLAGRYGFVFGMLVWSGVDLAIAAFGLAGLAGWMAFVVAELVRCGRER